MSIPLDSPQRLLRDPGAADQLRREFGGTREVDRDGSVYGSVGSRPIPPPRALRLIHANRQEEIRQREEDKEAEATMQELGMRVAKSRTLLHFSSDSDREAVRMRWRLAEHSLEVPLAETACSYDVQGCGLAECDGMYSYSASSRHGAPVYQNGSGWTLHRDRPPVEATIGTEAEVSEFGWLISKDGRPFYAARTDAMVAPTAHWECFLGPPPAPTAVSSTSWEQHLLGRCGACRERGNRCVKEARYEEALTEYSDALEELAGLEAVADASAALRELRLALRANRAEALLRLGRWEEAAADSRCVLADDPRHSKAAVRLAKACRALGRWAEAVGPLEAVVAGPGPGLVGAAAAEVQGLLEEARLLAGCQARSSRLAGIFEEIQLLKEQLSRVQAGRADSAALRAAAEAVCASLDRLAPTGGDADAELATEVGLLLRGTGLLEAALAALGEPAAAAWEWGADLLGSCLWPTAAESEVRRVLAALPGVAPQLAAWPGRALGLVRRLLRHPLHQPLRAADAVVEAPGLLAACLRPWALLLAEDAWGADAAEVLLGLSSQALRADCREALALGLFVEAFVGERREREGGAVAVTGGFVLQHGAAVRTVVLSLLRQWAEAPSVLQVLSPKLVGRIWLPLLVKLRREAGVEVEKEVVPGGPGRKALRMEWFQLRPGHALLRAADALHPEELLEAALRFLAAHLRATCARGWEPSPAEGIAARHPADEWLEEVMERPFGWGALLPLLAAPPPVCGEALHLLALCVERYPHNEKLAKRLAGLHAFFPLLGLPWPSSPRPAACHLGATLAAGPGPRADAARVLRCAVDTELAVRVAKDHPRAAVTAAVELLTAVLADGGQLEAADAAIETVGILVGNLGSWEFVSESAIFAVLEAFLRSTHASTRAQLAKLLRLAHSDAVAGSLVHHALGDERLGLSEQQRETVLREVFDFRTLAGQHKAESTAKLLRKVEETPIEAERVHAGGPEQSSAETRQHLDRLVCAIHEAYLQQREAPRVLLLGRIARALCLSLGSLYHGCRLVLGERTLERIAEGDLGGANAAAVLLPLPKDVASVPHLASQELFDLVIAGEPMGYLDIAEYADSLRPFIRRREKEDERQKDQVQWVTVELQSRLEDARDEMFGAGYYAADHDAACEGLRRAARRLGHDAALFALPSAEKELRKQAESRRAVERRARRNAEQEEQERREAEEERRRGVLYETLFDPMLSVPELGSLRLALEAGAPPEAADVLLVWLPGNGEAPGGEGLLRLLQGLCDAEAGRGRALRAVVPDFPEERGRWYGWTDEVAVGFGAEWFEMAEGPCKEDEEKAAKDPARNISFGRPSYAEMQGLEELELSCKQLLNFLDEALRSLRPGARVALGGFSQGGSTALYAAFGGLAAEELRRRLCGVVVCCSGIPVLHFLGPRLQAACLKARDEEPPADAHPLAVHLVFGRDDAEVRENFVETLRDFLRRFAVPVVLQRFAGGAPEDRFPEEVRKRHLAKALQALLP